MVRNRSTIILLFFAAVVFITFNSCDPSKKYIKEEAEAIQDYLSSNNNLDFVEQPSGLYFYEIVAGTGTSPVSDDSAFVKYTGMFLDGTVFDSNVSLSSLYGFIVGENITGFDEGITLMSEGGKATFLLPSSLAYGSYGQYPIKGYTPLIFEVELIKVVPGPWR